ncbi:hypothetical protein PHMEG_00031356 [Phytophthora megakarya]|uniref:Uncharacterized protein n=1 Tax=Phytophthora megakarya TaxID=4795 RepID=A0A225UXY7_9STRA|nr:hypothetical protein PHMEG_00031356 [Phytophthora megakarya]
MVHKRNISVDASNVLFLRLIRVKTVEEQGLSILPDVDFATCPVLVIALALVSQAAPCLELVGNLPAQAAPKTATLSSLIPLIALLNMPSINTALVAPAAPARSDTSPTIYTHANCVLDRIIPAAGVEATLTSHSFRRSGAQHENGCDEMPARWTFDRGSWNMNTTHKGFNYIFNTSKVDHNIAKVISVQRVLFSSCYKLESERYNVNKKVLDVLTACVVRHFPLLKALKPGSPVVKRVEVAVSHVKYSEAELLAWSSHLARGPVPCHITQPSDIQTSRYEAKPKEPTLEQKIIDYQAAVIQHL